MNQEISVFSQSIKDFFTPKMLKYALLPFIITLVLMYVLFFVLAGAGIEHLGSLDVETSQTTIENGVPHTETLSAKLEGLAIVEFLMSYAITSWIVTFFLYAVGGFLTLYLSIFVALLVIGFLTPFVLKELHKRHYSNVKMIGFSNIFEALFLAIKWAAIMLLLFLLLIPLYLIPLVNIIALNFPLYYFFHKMMLYDVGSTISSREEFGYLKYTKANSFRLKTLALYLVSLIPFVIFFGAIFFVIYLGHSYFLEIQKVRANKE
ncbi:MAG: EI24 domain-containing protein [Helicobacteraceae bacterium]|nr:EI24 domain-containing protein [Helicobacteraceae bacterium]